jgi:hypothetical protein
VSTKLQPPQHLLHKWTGNRPEVGKDWICPKKVSFTPDCVPHKGAGGQAGFAVLFTRCDADSNGGNPPTTFRTGGSLDGQVAFTLFTPVLGVRRSAMRFILIKSGAID